MPRNENNMSIVGLRRLWFTLSGALLLLSVLCIAVFGLNFGIDFTGGSLLELQVKGTRPAVEDVRSALGEAGFSNATIQETGAEQLLIRTEHLDESMHQQLLTALETRFGEVDERRFDSFGPSVGVELRNRALIGVAVTLLLIGLYVAFVFRKVSEPIASWKYGVLTLVTAFHDVLVPLGVFAIAGKFFGWQVDSAFVAAILTILGYSINDTIVVFDRTRENLAHDSGQEFEAVVEHSVKQTLSRSMITGVSSLIALVAISIWGGESTRPFAVALIVGILVGTYSSIFVASPLLVTWEKWRKK